MFSLSLRLLTGGRIPKFFSKLCMHAGKLYKFSIQKSTICKSKFFYLKTCVSCFIASCINADCSSLKRHKLKTCMIMIQPEITATSVYLKFGTHFSAPLVLTPRVNAFPTHPSLRHCTGARAWVHDDEAIHK
jgi:hypothetical protein